MNELCLLFIPGLGYVTSLVFRALSVLRFLGAATSVALPS